MSSRFREDIISEEFIKKVLKHHLKEENELLEFQSNPGTAIGDNYMGDLASVQVRAKLESGEEKSFTWMIKLLKPDPSSGKHLGRLMKVLNKEAAFYRDILPALNQIANLEYCPMIYVDETYGKEAIVLEHMKQFGWRDAINKKAGLSLEHVQLVLEWMAKFHGLSYVMMNNYPGGVEAWRKDHPWSVPMSENPPEIVMALFEMMREDQMAKFLRLAEILEEENPETDYVARVKSFLASGAWIHELRSKANSSKGRPFNTLCHLDPWFNNMLFNFETATSTQPKKVLLLDFQLSAFTHPGNDLAYFLLTSTTPEFRADHLDSVFKGYFETLHRVVKEAGIGDFSYTMEQLQEDYKIGLNIGPVLLMMALPMMMNFSPEDVVDFGGMDISDSETKKQFEKLNSDNFEVTLKKHPFLRNRVKGVFDDIVKANII